MDKIVKACQRPLYVETGIRSFDSTILKGRKHPQLINTLRKQMYDYLKQVVSLLNNRGSGVSMSIELLHRESILVRLFEALEYYVQFPKHKKPKKHLKNLRYNEMDFLVCSYEIFYILQSYVISQQVDWVISNEF